MRLIEEFTLSQAIVICPACNTSFSTPHLANMPVITAETPIETDLHRVLPNGAIRAALIAFCRDCGYAWWITAFKCEEIHGDSMTADEYSLERLQYPRKFANAFLTGRQNGAHSRELALLALNGGWCAREAGLPHERWFDLAAQEMEKALSDKAWSGNRGYYRYLMGEICRQQRKFSEALDHFGKINFQSRLPRELILRQKVQATAGDASPTRLPPYLVELIFCPRRYRRASPLQNDH